MFQSYREYLLTANTYFVRVLYNLRYQGVGTCTMLNFILNKASLPWRISYYPPVAASFVLAHVRFISLTNGQTGLKRLAAFRSPIYGSERAACCRRNRNRPITFFPFKLWGLATLKKFITSSSLSVALRLIKLRLCGNERACLWTICPRGYHQPS